MNITLPSTSRRAMLRSFWFVISVLSGLTVAILAFWLGPGMLWASVLMTVALAMLVFVKERFVWRLYGAWNSRLARPVSAILQRVVLRLCYFIVFTAVGRAGSRLPRAEREACASFWSPRSSLAAEAYRAPFAAVWEGRRGGWVRQYLIWAFRSGNAWAVALLPYIVLLRLCSSPEEKGVAGNIYTLF
jgi:hypothetical protein